MSGKSTALLPLAALLAAGCSSVNPVEVTFKHSVVGRTLSVQYSVVNRSRSPIVLFDGNMNRETGVPGVNEAWVDVQGGTATFKAALVPSPDGSLMEFPNGFARELSPGSRAEGAFRLALPLRQSDTGYPLEEKRAAVELDTIQMVVGWAPKSATRANTDAERPAGMGAEYRLFFFEVDNHVQRFATSAPVKLGGAGLIP